MLILALAPFILRLRLDEILLIFVGSSIGVRREVVKICGPNELSLELLALNIFAVCLT